MGTRLFVGNLSYNTSEETLRGIFEGNGRHVREVKIILDRETGHPRGFGFVEMATQDDANAAMAELNGVVLDGRPLNVNEATERGRGGVGAPRVFNGPSRENRPPNTNFRESSSGQGQGFRNKPKRGRRRDESEGADY